MPTFDHSFTPPAASTLGASVDLDVREIEDAGLFEILQTPGAALTSWQFLDALLDPAVTTFSFLEPLGQAREVKTAVSGLFGRFVARAYATRYLGLMHFYHVRKPPMRLMGVLRGELRRVPGHKGDMPDWIAWGPSVGMAIVEAKGCHDAKNPGAALARAYAQAGRAEIFVGGRRAPFKRFAIATRWGFTSPKASQPMLWVQDPEVDGEMTPEEEKGLEVAIARWHIATLLAPLGHVRLAHALTEMNRAYFANRLQRERNAAIEALDATVLYRVDGDADTPQDKLVGGFVSRAGPLAGTIVGVEDQGALRRLGLRPTFVGLEVTSIREAIEGIPRQKEKIPIGQTVIAPRRLGSDGGGGWVVRLDQDESRVAPLA